MNGPIHIQFGRGNTAVMEQDGTRTEMTVVSAKVRRRLDGKIVAEVVCEPPETDAGPVAPPSSSPAPAPAVPAEVCA